MWFSQSTILKLWISRTSYQHYWPCLSSFTFCFVLLQHVDLQHVYLKSRCQSQVWCHFLPGHASEEHILSTTEVNLQHARGAGDELDVLLQKCRNMQLYIRNSGSSSGLVVFLCWGTDTSSRPDVKTELSWCVFYKCELHWWAGRREAIQIIIICTEYRNNPMSRFKVQLGVISEWICR